MTNDFEQNLSDQVLDSLEDDAEQKKIKWLSFFLAFLCLAALIAVIWHLYSMSQSIGQKDNGTDVAVISAPEGPVKVKPDNPGGMKIPHQDKLVFQTLLPEEKAKKVEEKVLPSPEKPDADLAQQSLEDKIKMIDEITEEPVTILLAASDEKPKPEKKAKKVVKKKAEKPIPVKVSKETEKAMAAAKPTPVKKAAAKPKPKKVAKKKAAFKPAGSAGTYRVQLGAYRDARVSKAEANRLKSKFGVLSNLTVFTPKADLGARGFMYRVQLGPLGKAEAKRVCGVLKSKGQGCFIARK